MATFVEISFVKKRNNELDPHARIEGLGGLFNNKPWYMSERNIIAEAEKPDAKKVWNFYVSVEGEMVPVVVGSREGRKYLKIHAEDYQSTALLGLPEFPPLWAGKSAACSF